MVINYIFLSIILCHESNEHSLIIFRNHVNERTTYYCVHRFIYVICRLANTFVL